MRMYQRYGRQTHIDNLGARGHHKYGTLVVATKCATPSVDTTKCMTPSVVQPRDTLGGATTGHPQWGNHATPSVGQAHDTLGGAST